MTSSIMAISEIRLYFTYITIICLSVIIITFSTIEQMTGMWTLQVFSCNWLINLQPVTFYIPPSILSHTEHTNYILITNVAPSNQ